MLDVCTLILYRSVLLIYVKKKANNEPHKIGIPILSITLVICCARHGRIAVLQFAALGQQRIDVYIERGSGGYRYLFLFCAVGKTVFPLVGVAAFDLYATQSVQLLACSCSLYRLLVLQIQFLLLLKLFLHILLQQILQFIYNPERTKKRKR